MNHESPAVALLRKHFPNGVNCSMSDVFAKLRGFPVVRQHHANKHSTAAAATPPPIDWMANAERLLLAQEKHAATAKVNELWSRYRATRDEVERQRIAGEIIRLQKSTKSAGAKPTGKSAIVRNAEKRAREAAKLPVVHSPVFQG